jgi:dTDP-4-dehydrorhamnose 3,5-epimerase
MPYQVTPTAIPDVLLLEPRVFSDERGYFFESFNAREFRERTGLAVEFVQDNHSMSERGVLRGLHYQIRHPQGKLLRAVKGSVFDVAVDLRTSSPTFGRWVGAMLSSENRRQLWIPPGFAHGFLALSDRAEVLYKITDYWYPEHERTLLWNDPTLAIAWPVEGEPRLALKDVEGKRFGEIELFG